MIGVRYRVCGRYKNGSEVTHYRMMRSDGVAEKATREKVIMLISKGLVDNMRIQVRSEDDIIIRGKGINLNDLPVVKEDKDLDRRTEQVDNRYIVTKRLMYGTKCVGYVVEDCNGNKKMLSKKDVQQLAINKRIKNVEVSKYIDKVTGNGKLVMRGVGCNLLQLEVVPVDANGNVVNKSGATCRAIFMKESGILEDRKTMSTRKFGMNSFIVYTMGGNVEIESMEEMKRKYSIEREANIATCDSYLDECERYTIRLTSGKETTMEADKILNWTIARRK